MVASSFCAFNQWIVIATMMCAVLWQLEVRSTIASSGIESFYDILNTTANASDDEIKKKYRKLVLVYHPDKFRFQNFTNNESVEESTATFLKIQQAYEILSDPERRKQYDLSFEGISYEIVEEEKDEDNSRRYQSKPFTMFARTKSWKLFISAQFLKKKIEDVVINLQLDFKHTLTGYSQKHVYYRKKVCDTCGGTGGLHGECNPCNWCQGTGVGPHYFGTPGLDYEQLTKTRCDHCQGRGCIPVGKCPNCNGRGISMVESLIDIALPMGFSNGLQWTVPQAGHMDLSDGRIGDVSITVKYNLPPGWVYDAASAQLGYVLFLSIDDLLQGYTTSLTTPCDEVVPIEIPRGLKLSQVLFEAITIRATGYGGYLMFDHTSGRALRADLLIAVKADIKSIPGETFLRFLEEGGIDKDDPLFKRFLKLLVKNQSKSKTSSPPKQVEEGDRGDSEL